ncbi:MAG: hypothetical protein LBJ00_03815 [Planctomycetaceae bacterium]|nr:hypothetical protein [Planctomycetaceae bacterium]
MKFPKRNTQTQQREADAQGRSLSPYRLRYKNVVSGFPKILFYSSELPQTSFSPNFFLTTHVTHNTEMMVIIPSIDRKR